MPPRRPDPARERMWRKRLARWKASGLKVGAFCEREGVTPTAFAHWRKESRGRHARVIATNNPPSYPSASRSPSPHRPSKWFYRAVG